MPSIRENLYRYRDSTETIFLSCKGGTVQINLLQVDEGWAMGYSLEFRCGNFSGSACPVSGRGRDNAAYSSRAEAVRCGLEKAKNHFAPDRPGKNEAQKNVAIEMTRLIEQKMNEEAQESLFS